MGLTRTSRLTRIAAETAARLADAVDVVAAVHPRELVIGGRARLDLDETVQQAARVMPRVALVPDQPGAMAYVYQLPPDDDRHDIAVEHKYGTSP